MAAHAMQWPALFGLTALLLAVPCAAQDDSQAEPTTPAPEPTQPTELPAEFESPLVLDLPAAIALARARNFGLAASAAGLAIDELDPFVQRGVFDALLQISADHAVTRRGGISFQSQIAGGSESESTDLAVSAIQPTRHGGQWTLLYGTGRNKSSSSLGSSDDDNEETWSSSTQLRYSQPLLEGFGRRVNRFPITQAEINAAISAIGFQQDALDLEQRVTGQYLAILRAMRQLDISEFSLSVAQALLNQTDAQVDAGVLAEFERANARGGLAVRLENTLQAEAALADARDALKQTLAIPDEVDLILADELNIAGPIRLEREIAQSLALEHRTEFAILDLREELSAEQLANARDALANTLNFDSSFGFSGEALDFGDSLNDMDNFSWAIGLEYIIPLGTDHRAEGQLEQAELSLEQLALQRTETTSQVLTGVAATLRALGTAYERLGITQTGVEVAEERLANEQARLDLGLSTTTLLLDVEEDLATARLRRIQAELDYAEAKAQLLLTLGLSQLEAPPAELSDPAILPGAPSGVVEGGEVVE